MGDLFGGIEVFADAHPDDGMLDVGVLTSDGPVQSLRAVSRTALGSAEKSPCVRVTQGRSLKVKLDRKVRYELDGGDRKKVKSFEVDIEAGAITVCVRARPRRTNQMTTNVSSESEDLGDKAKREGDQLAGAKPLGWLARAGLIGRGVIYGIIGILALKLALGDGGEATDQQGAMTTIAQQSFGEVLRSWSRSRSRATPFGGWSARLSATAPSSVTTAPTASRQSAVGSPRDPA